MVFTFCLQLQQQFAKVDDPLWVKSGRGLVQDDQIRIMQQSLRKAQPLFHSVE